MQLVLVEMNMEERFRDVELSWHTKVEILEFENFGWQESTSGELETDSLRKKKLLKKMQEVSFISLLEKIMRFFEEKKAKRFLD